MGRKKKIDDEQLRKELKLNKTVSEIAEKHGLNTEYLTTLLSKKGFRKLNNVNEMSHGSATISIGKKHLQEIRELNDFSQDSALFVERNVRSDGDMVLKFRQNAWVED